MAFSFGHFSQMQKNMATLANIDVYFSCMCFTSDGGM